MFSYQMYRHPRLSGDKNSWLTNSEEMYLATATSPSFRSDLNSSDHGLSFWLYMSEEPTLEDWFTIVSVGGSDEDGEWTINVYNSEETGSVTKLLIRISQVGSGTYDRYIGDLEMVRNTWYHVVFSVRGSTTFQCWINGEKNPLTLVEGSDNFYWWGDCGFSDAIMSWTTRWVNGTYSTNNKFNGYLTELSYHDDYINTDGALALYNSGNPLGASVSSLYNCRELWRAQTSDETIPDGIPDDVDASDPLTAYGGMTVASNWTSNYPP